MSGKKVDSVFWGFPDDFGICFFSPHYEKQRPCNGNPCFLLTDLYDQSASKTQTTR